MTTPLFYVEDHLGLGTPNTYAVYYSAFEGRRVLRDVHDLNYIINMTAKELDDQLASGNWKKVER